LVWRVIHRIVHGRFRPIPGCSWCITNNLVQMSDEALKRFYLKYWLDRAIWLPRVMHGASMK